MTENKPNTSSIFHTDFLPFAIRWGRGLSLFGIVLAFGPCLGLAVMGIFPSVSGVMAGIAAQLPAVVAAYFYEPISYFAILGIAGTYMGFLSGNVNNMRAPCASIAQSAANVEEGSDEGGIIATVGIAVSICQSVSSACFGCVKSIAPGSVWRTLCKSNCKKAKVSACRPPDYGYHGPNE